MVAAELLAAKLVDASELKDYLANICCESYIDLDKHLANVESLEANFPTYSEHTECQGDLVWGDMKLGRLPQFLYDDAAIWKTQSSHSVQNSNSLNASHSVQMIPHSVEHGDCLFLW